MYKKTVNIAFSVYYAIFSCTKFLILFDCNKYKYKKFIRREHQKYTIALISTDGDSLKFFYITGTCFPVGCFMYYVF